MDIIAPICINFRLLFDYIEWTGWMNPLISLISIIIASWTALLTRKALVENNRPMIIFSIEPGENIKALYFVISNTGNRTADNVKITISPLITSITAKQNNIPLIMNENGIINLSGLYPTQTVKSFFDHAFLRYENNDERDKLIEIADVEISYQYGKRSYKEKAHIDFSYIKKLTDIKKDTKTEDNLKKIADSLVEINKTLKDNHENKI
ncbi:hypothetical protein JEZ13_03180 [bacterium]|nr:hypothetical protein [bacterium]